MFFLQYIFKVIFNYGFTVYVILQLALRILTVHWEQPDLNWPSCFVASAVYVKIRAIADSSTSKSN